MAYHPGRALGIGANALGILIALGCGSETTTGMPSIFSTIRIPLTPPASYSQWWGQMEQCSGLTGSFASVKWYQVPGVASFPSVNGVAVYAAWELDSNSITLSGANLDNVMLVRHEELHALLQSHGHPAEYFVTKCGALVGPYTD